MGKKSKKSNGFVIVSKKDMKEMTRVIKPIRK